MKTATQKTIISAMFAALVCVATMVIKIPSPLNGYINLGDGLVLLSGWVLPGWYGFFAAAMGSALADIFSGYIMYAPATFIIKGLMAVIAVKTSTELSKKSSDLTARMIGAVLAELFMIIGYFVFEGFIYGFVPSAVNIPANAVQGVGGIVVGLMLIKVFEKQRLIAILTGHQEIR